MDRIFDSSTSRQMDQALIEAGDSLLGLIEKTGASIAAKLRQRYQDKTIVFCCGGGNNGADGLSAALLMGREQKITVCLVHEKPVHPTLTALFSALEDMGITAYDCTSLEQWEAIAALMHPADIYVDALLGTGSDRPVAGLLERVVGWINEQEGTTVSVDIPTGVLPDSGAVSPATIQADLTLSVMAHKPGVVLYPGAGYAGEKVVLFPFAENFQPERLRFEMDETGIAPFHRERFSHKNTFGHVSLVVGSKGYSGAGALCAWSALKSGVGLVSIASPASTAEVYRYLVPGAMTKDLPEDAGGYGPAKKELEEHFKYATALVLGCGMGQSNGVWPAVFQALETKLPAVLDADALNVLAYRGVQALQHLHHRAVVTPHPAELARLMHTDTTDILHNPLARAEQFAKDTGVVVVLKNASTIIASPKYTAISQAGCAGMAKGGSGDVLAGCIGSLLAQGFSQFDSACMGVEICGLAGCLAEQAVGSISMQPSDTIEYLPQVFNRFTA